MHALKCIFQHCSCRRSCLHTLFPPKPLRHTHCHFFLPPFHPIHTITNHLYPYIIALLLYLTFTLLPSCFPPVSLHPLTLLPPVPPHPLTLLPSVSPHPLTLLPPVPPHPLTLLPPSPSSLLFYLTLLLSSPFFLFLPPVPPHPLTFLPPSPSPNAALS